MAPGARAHVDLPGLFLYVSVRDGGARAGGRHQPYPPAAAREIAESVSLGGPGLRRFPCQTFLAYMYESDGQTESSC